MDTSWEEAEKLATDRTGPDLGGSGGPRAPGLLPTGGFPPNPSIFKTL